MTDLLKKSAKEVRDWLDEVLLGDGNLPVEQDLFTVAHYCLSGFQASSESADTQLIWGECAVSFFQVLSIINPTEGKRYKQAEMHVRARMLIAFGNNIDYYVLNKVMVEQWFFESSELNINVVQEMARQWKSLPKDQILQLREYKNRISMLESLVDAGIQFLNKELYVWISIKRMLP